MRLIEDRSEEAGVSKDALMENAGLEVARRVRRHIGYIEGERIVILVGPGNNGGDGMVAARHLHRWKARVLVYICASRRMPDPKREILLDMGVPIVSTLEDASLDQLKEALSPARMVVDAALGTGHARPIEGTLKDIFSELTEVRSRRPDMQILALDLPTGLNADTGAVDPVCPAADITVTLGYPKIGHFAYPGADKIGKLEIADISIPPGLDDDVTLELMTPGWASQRLPQRPSSSHKGSFGRTLVMAGSRNFIGAAYLASTAATRAGAGLVTIALPESIQMAVAAKAIEPTYLPLPETSSGVLSPEAIGVIADNLPQYEAMLIGCGLGMNHNTIIVVERLLDPDFSLPPTVVDADGLNILAHIDNWWERFAASAIVTPHPGEMARLTGTSIGEVQSDRLGVARESAAKWNKIVVLKGAHTVVAYPDDRAMISPFANAGLASAGTGDVLSGVIAGLLSQGLTLEDAAALGVFVHAQAGENVRQRLGDTGMLASDLLPELPCVIKALRERGDRG